MNDVQPEDTDELVAPRLGDIADPRRFLEHFLRLLDDALAHGRDADFALAPLEIPVTSRFVRQRRHMRVRLQKPVRAVSVNLKENCLLDIKTASLTGGVATISRHLAPGTQVQLKLQIGMRNLQATAIMRDYRAQDMAFEIVDMNLDERSKFRRLLAGNLPYGAVSADRDVAAVPAGVVVSK